MTIDREELMRLLLDDAIGEATTQRQLGGPTVWCPVPLCCNEEPCWRYK